LDTTQESITSALKHARAPWSATSGRAGVAGQGEASGDGGEVLADVGGEGVQFGLVVGFDVVEPAGEVFAAGASGHHLGEAGDMPGEAVGLGAVAAQFGEQLLRSPCPLVLVWPQNGAVMSMQSRPWPDVPGLTSRAGAKMIRS
jgi:hypothetical protein